MTRSTPKRSHRRRRTAAVAAAVVAFVSQLAGVAEARPYKVVSCDSAGLFAYNASAWVPYGTAGRAYASCPSGGGDVAGISNRMTGGTFAGFAGSGHAFTAPPGTTITNIRWAGRIAREACYWGAYIRAQPSGAAVLGAPPNQFCGTTGIDARNFPLTFPVPDGTTRLEQLVVCGATQCQPGATLHSQQLEVTIEDPTPPSISIGGPLASGRWVSGVAGTPQVDVTVTDNAGVRSVGVVVPEDSRAFDYACDWSQARPCVDRTSVAANPTLAKLRDGRHLMRVSAEDAAGNPASVATDILVDNTPPEPIVPQVAAGIGWRRTNAFAASWTNPTGQAAPIVRAHWKICSRDGVCPARGQTTARGLQQLPDLSVPGPGDYRLHVWLEDEAGNQREANAAVAAPLRYDPEPPALAFQAPDPDDPLRVVVSANDAHSGVADGDIEMRAVGSSAWHALETQTTGDRLVAYVDDQRFRSGAYEFRAHAVDRAGNEASTGRRDDGYAATLRLPVRVETQLAVGVPRTALRRRVVRRGGRRRVIRRPVRTFARDVVAPLGRALRLRGVIETAEGQPIDGATIEAFEKTDRDSRLLGVTTSNRNGEFTYSLRATRNRELVFQYRGSRRVGAAREVFKLSVPAFTTMRADRYRVRNGKAVTFAGRVESRPIPPAGKLIEMQSFFRRRWRTFSTVRTEQNGRWRFSYRFGATVGRVVYPFRAQLPLEGGYPFIDGRSRVIEVVVLGP